MGKAFQWGREFRALCDGRILKAVLVGVALFQWGREFRALCDPFDQKTAVAAGEVFQWGREFRALCDSHRIRRPIRRASSFNGAANSARSVTGLRCYYSETSIRVSMGPRIPRAL